MKIGTVLSASKYNSTALFYDFLTIFLSSSVDYEGNTIEDMQ